MITILALDTSFAAVGYMRAAFSQWEETRLITLLNNDRYPQDTDILLTNETVAKCRALVEDSRFTVLGDGAGFGKGMIARLAPDPEWARQQQWVPFFGDSAYFLHHKSYNEQLYDLGVKQFFVLPNLLPQAPPGAVPLHHPLPPLEIPGKHQKLTVTHSYAYAGKKHQKGTEIIEQVITELQAEAEFDFAYIPLTQMTHAEAMALKGRCHIVIDQIPQGDRPAGLGRSGTEGLGLGCVVLSRMYPWHCLRGFMKPPPVTSIYDAASLRFHLEPYLRHRDLVETIGAESRVWAEKYLFYDTWLDYFEHWLNQCRLEW